MFHQKFDIFFSLIQRRYINFDYRKSVIKVFTEFSFRDFLFHIFIGRRNNSHINSNFLIASHRRNFAFLKGAQNFGLCNQAHIANFIKENGTVLSEFEFSLFIFNGTSKTTFYVTKKFRFDQFGRDRGAVYFNHRTFAAVTLGVDCVCHQFFSGTVGTSNEDSRVGSCDFFNHILDFFQSRRFADHLVFFVDFLF